MIFCIKEYVTSVGTVESLDRDKDGFRKYFLIRFEMIFFLQNFCEKKTEKSVSELLSFFMQNVIFFIFGIWRTLPPPPRCYSDLYIFNENEFHHFFCWHPLLSSSSFLFLLLFVSSSCCAAISASYSLWINSYRRTWNRHPLNRKRRHDQIQVTFRGRLSRTYSLSGTVGWLRSLEVSVSTRVCIFYGLFCLVLKYGPKRLIVNQFVCWELNLCVWKALAWLSEFVNLSVFFFFFLFDPPLLSVSPSPFFIHHHHSSSPFL